MQQLLEYLPIIIYVLLFAGIKLSERFLLTRPENTIRRGLGGLDGLVYPGASLAGADRAYGGIFSAWVPP